MTDTVKTYVPDTAALNSPVELSYALLGLLTIEGNFRTSPYEYESLSLPETENII